MLTAVILPTIMCVNRSVLFGLLGLISSFSFGQGLEFSTTSLDFGSLQKGQSDSLQLTCYNRGESPIQVLDVNLYSQSLNKDFKLIADTAFTLAADDSAAIWVKFKPVHNINYNTELVVLCEYYGAYSIDVKGIGTYPGTYYSSTQNLSEQALKDALKTKLNTGAIALGYNTGRDWLYMTIDNQQFNGEGASQNRIETAYTGRVVEGYVNRSAAQTNGNVNTEHTWPQSLGASSDPANSDLFHLYVVDASANSVRSNNPFGHVLSATWQNGGSLYGGGIFEPRDAQKGKTARSMLYFATRYGNSSNFLSVQVPNANGQFVTQEQVLRQWAAQFPVNTIDSIRNEKIFGLQKNRNPYIDHPEFLERITTLSTNSVAATVRSISVNLPEQNGSIAKLSFGGTVGDTVSYNLVITSAGNAAQNLTLSTSNGANLGWAQSAVSVNPGESVTIELKISRSQQVHEEDTIVISGFGITSLRIPVQVDFFSTGLNSLVKEVTLYPNPGQGVFQIALENAYPAEMEIFDSRGVKVKSAVLNTPLNEIRLSELYAGVYFVRIWNEHGNVLIPYVLK
ncbi:MAG: choice-of-anchor D domain-containing protein [Bacteroidetes bacterium]|nr:MAG: choice-of-anchor D domain-containing protein [Bacteroidota bacterium]